MISGLVERTVYSTSCGDANQPRRIDRRMDRRIDTEDRIEVKEGVGADEV